MVKKLNFVKENKTIVRSSHPPLDMFIINYKGTEIKVSPIKIVEIIDANTPISVEKKKEAKQNTSTSATHAISRKREEIGFFEDSWPIWS